MSNSANQNSKGVSKSYEDVPTKPNLYEDVPTKPENFNP